MALRFGRNSSSEPDPRHTEGRMTLGEHLKELRSRAIKAVVAVGVGAIVGWLLYDPVSDLLLDPYCEILPPGRLCTLIVTNPLEAFSVRMKLATYVGFLLASPVVMWQLWRFVTPGLYDREKRYAIPFVVCTVFLFVAGAGLALWTFPQALEFLSSVGGEQIEAFYTPGNYYRLITVMMVSFGVGFQFPVLLTFLQLARVLHWRTLASWRRYAIVLIFVATAVITPGGDPISLMALALPMVLFYEGSILIGRFVFKRP